jgi:hypothetical protein
MLIKGLAASVFAQSAREVRGPSPYATVANEPAAKPIVDPPLPDQLARGAVQWLLLGNGGSYVRYPASGPNAGGGMRRFEAAS